MYKIRIGGKNYKISTCQNIGRVVDLWKHLYIHLKLGFFFLCVQFTIFKYNRKRNFSGESLS